MIDLASLRRWPDLEAPDLPATDAADRLLLDESMAARTNAAPGDIVVIGDAYGALALGAAEAGARDVRVHQDAIMGERALAANASTWDLGDRVRSLPLDGDLVRGARVVLLRLPRSLDALRDIAGLVAAHAAPEVVVYAGGRIKHMSLAMNDVLRASFDHLDVTRARQKARVLIARGPRDGRDPVAAIARHDGLAVCAYGGAFAGTRIDIGTRLLLAQLPEALPAAASADGEGAIVDLACGTGVIAATLALRHPSIVVHASDASAVAVASARATAAANGVGDRVRVVQDDALASMADATAAFIALNPPFHSGAAVTDALAPRLFADAARVLAPGGELWCVWNSPLRYRPALERIVGPTRQVARDAKFTVTVSTRR